MDTAHWTCFSPYLSFPIHIFLKSHIKVNFLKIHRISKIFIFEILNDRLGGIRERPFMMSDFRGEWGSEMSPKNRTLEGENRTKGGCRIKKSSDIDNGRSLSFLTFQYLVWNE